MRYQTKGTCSTAIDVEVKDGRIESVKFTGGCNGNLKAIAKLVEGLTVEQIEEKLLGNTCGFKNTSCADQLARAVRKAKEE